MATKTKAKEKPQALSLTVPGGNIEMIRHIKLDDLLPNPYQPATRVEVDPETAKKFAYSIQEHGLIQTPVVRHVLGDGASSQERIVNGHYEVGDGWLRRAGYLFNFKEFGLQDYAEYISTQPVWEGRNE